MDELFQVFPKGPAVHGLVSFAHSRSNIFQLWEEWIIPDRSWVPNPWLNFDGIAYLINGEPQWSEVFHPLVGTERIWREDQERLSLEGRMPMVLILGMSGGFMRRF